MQGFWSGEEDWSRSAYLVTPGIHALKWSYEKDFSVNNGSDCAWLDYIIFPSALLITSVEEPTLTESSFEIYPNPVNNSTGFYYTIIDDSQVSIVIFNSVGQEVKNLVNNYQPKGIYKLTTDLSKLSSGIYLCKLSTKNGSITKKIVIK